MTFLSSRTAASFLATPPVKVNSLVTPPEREDILAGLHRAIILRAISIISRSGGVTNEFTFTGGVAKNEAAVRELRKVIKENYGDVTININPDSIYTGALGAAEFARRAHSGQADGSEQQ